MASPRSMRRLAALFCVLGALALPSVTEAAIPNIPDGGGGNIPCSVQTGTSAGQRWCSGIFTTFDGAPIDINVAFPAAPASGPDGNFPIIGVFHGWGGSKLPPTTGGWVNNGYAFFSMSDRGWGNSCGGMDSKRSQPVCANGYNHLMDTRFEVRDAQQVFEALADAHATGGGATLGLIDPQKIGVNGGSYGGGISMALAALKDRKMVQAGDGTLVPWVSPDGKAMRIAAAQPDIPWTDLAYSLQPNGHTLDYVVDSPYLKRGRIGVMKQSFVSGLYATGQATSNYAPPGTDPDADLVTWFASINAGEPYDQNPTSQDIVDEITKHHSSYYIDHSEAPAPLLISNGFTDDLFPPDEAIRFYNRTRAQFPGTPISLLFSDHGHMRGQNKVPDGALLSRQLHNWFDYYVKGTGPAPYLGVQTLTQVCGGPSGGATGPFDDVNTDLPFQAPTWAQLAPGEVQFSGSAGQVIAPDATDQAGTAFDPVAGGGACATAPAGDQAGTANYRSAPAPAGGFTLMGSPTIVADVNSPGPTSQLAARLEDVDPSTGNETLVARGLYRPEINSGTEATRQVFQLHPNGWKFDSGHVAKLELLPDDQPYGRSSNGQATITVSNLELRLPVLEQPGSFGGLVRVPAVKVVPPGYELSPDYVPTGYPRPRGATPFRVSLVPAFDQCTSSNRTHGAPLSFASCAPPNPSSDFLTVGTPDANGQPANSIGYVLYEVGAADVNVSASVTDVRTQGTLADYTGELSVAQTVQITDRLNGPAQDEPGTVQANPFRYAVPCSATASTSVGATCSVSSSFNAILPGSVVAGKRAIWELQDVQVFDGGPDGQAGTTSGNTLFERQGVFVP
jgi:Acetyl xylan esterase (AXE1)